MTIRWLAPHTVLPGLHTEAGEVYEVADDVGAACIADGLAEVADEITPDEGEE